MRSPAHRLQQLPRQALPRCQSLARAQWLEDRRAELLDTQYFHVVFTLPGDIAAIAYHNKALVYRLLFRAAAETLHTIAADPKHLGAEIGFFAVLHSWGQNLLHHPHLHCVVASGGLSADGRRWIACKPGFFLPVRVLSRLFRRLFLEHLKKAFDASQLQFFSGLQHLSERDAFRRYLAPLRKAVCVNDRGIGTPHFRAKEGQTQSRCMCRVMSRNFREGISAMEQRFGSTRLAPAGLLVEHAEINTDCVFLDVRATALSATCPCCGTSSRRTQSRYMRQAADLPIAGRRVVLRVTVRRFWCDAVLCRRRIFAERFGALGRCREEPDALRPSFTTWDWRWAAGLQPPLPIA